MTTVPGSKELNVSQVGELSEKIHDSGAVDITARTDSDFFDPAKRVVEFSTFS